MRTVAALRRAKAPAEGSSRWRERSARLYEQLRRPSRAMIRRAFRGAFADDEIEDIYANAWVGTLRALERRHDELSDEEVRRYVLTAVANHASKELRRRSRRPTAPLETVHTVPDHHPLPDERAAMLEHSRITRDLLASLPPRRRAVMLLRYGWGLEPRQVCGLVKGLSPRAYRKEVTRGVDEFTAKLRMVESGEWCADREPVLKAYAADLADPEQVRQARQHLSHCRRCADFVAQLRGHLDDLGASITAPTALDGVGDGHLSIADRLGEVIHRARDSVGGPFGGGSADGAAEVGGQATTLSTGARGAGAASAGALAKVAGLGTVGKVAAVCLGSGAAATACLVTGVVPAHFPGDGDRPQAASTSRPAQERPAPPGPSEPVQGSPTPAENEPAPPPAPDGAGGAAEPPLPEPAPEPPPPPIEPSAPPAQQEFGVASPQVAASPSSASAPSSSGGGGSAVQREFGP